MLAAGERVGGRRLPGGERDGEGRTLTEAGALGMHAPAVAVNQVAHDREPQAEATIGPRRGSVALLEGREGHTTLRVRRFASSSAPIPISANNSPVSAPRAAAGR